jgi:hypothetical protein
LAQSAATPASRPRSADSGTTTCLPFDRHHEDIAKQPATTGNIVDRPLGTMAYSAKVPAA